MTSVDDLVESHYAQACTIATKALRTYPASIRNEAVPECVWGLYAAAELFDPSFNVKFSTFMYEWVVRQVRRAARDLRRRRMEALPPDVEKPAEASVTAEDVFAVLTEDEAALVRGYFFEKKPLHELADSLGYTRQHVGNLLQAALEHARDALGAAYIGGRRLYQERE